MPIHPHDFCYMLRGRQIQPASSTDMSLLAAVEKVHPTHKNSALLMLHGFSSSPAVFRLLQPLLPQYDAIIAPPLPGHGESIVAFESTPAEKWLSFAESSCETLMETYKRVDILGLSLGGLLACHLSQLYPIHHLYLLAPALALQFNPTVAASVTRTLKSAGFAYVRNFAGNVYTPEHAELCYRLVPFNSILELMTLIHGFDIKPPPCETDLFLGAHDNIVSTQLVAQHFQQNLQVNTHWLKHSAHALPLDADIKQIATCINTHFEKKHVKMS